MFKYICLLTGSAESGLGTPEPGEGTQEATRDRMGSSYRQPDLAQGGEVWRLSLSQLRTGMTLWEGAACLARGKYGFKGYRCVCLCPALNSSVKMSVKVGNCGYK